MNVHNVVTTFCDTRNEKESYFQFIYNTQNQAAIHRLFNRRQIQAVVASQLVKLNPFLKKYSYLFKVFLCLSNIDIYELFMLFYSINGILYVKAQMYRNINFLSKEFQPIVKHQTSEIHSGSI